MKKSLATISIIISVTILVAGAFFIGFKAGARFPQNIEITEVSGINSESNLSADFTVFWQAWDKIKKLHISEEKISTQDKIYGAISGMIASLGDPYSQFFNPEDGKKFEEDVEGRFGGIGAEIGIRKDQLTIISPLKNSPASKSGLKPGDKIIEIDKKSSYDLTIDQAVSVIRGPIGSIVNLLIFRDGWEKPKEFSIKRATVIVPTVELEMIDKIAHLSLYSFNQNTLPLVQEEINNALSQNAKGIILDLRNNPGGYLDVSINLAGAFLKKDSIIVKEEARIKEDSRTYKATKDGELKDFPIVILINNGSASASEILAGALHDNRKIKLIGEKTYGKGTVQTLEELKDGSKLKITIAHWVLPSGKILEGDGISPDIEVKESDDPEKDLQLDKALEVIKKEINLSL
jgi:carboxyl-terminal processing protease